MVKINGKLYDVSGQSVSEYLKTTNYDMGKIAIECNGNIVPKAKYEETILADGDSTEIVSLVGGG